MRPKYSATLLLVVLVIVSAIEAPITWSAEACVPPPGFVDTPPPEIAPIDELVSHTEEIAIDYPLAVVRESGSRGRLEETIDRHPGSLGAEGDRVFRETFLDPVFSRWMRKTLENGKKRVGHVTTSHPNATGRAVHLIIQ